MTHTQGCSYATIRAEGGDLLSEYADECSIGALGRPNPQWEMYAAMEAAGLFQAFEVRVGGEFVGFGTMLLTVLPHYGVKAATVESLFVAAAYRKTGAGTALKAAMKAHAKADGCKCIMYSAPAGGQLEKLLGRRSARTSSVFIESLSE